MVIKTWDRFSGGIADFNKESPTPDAYAFGQSIDVRSNPQQVSLLPRTIKESGTVVTDLIKWGEIYLPTLKTYMYGDTGNLYSRTSAQSYSFLRTVPNSHGNGLLYSAEDDFLYYPSDEVIGRYGPLSATSPTFVDDFLGSQGGVPLNTASVDFESSSSQYASRADTASLSITGDLSLDLQVKPESLPTVTNSMSLISKWDESGATRSYRFDIAGVSGFFGDGSDGTLTISSNTTEAPIDSACTGTNASTSLSATNGSFATGQVILIHQTRGTGAGNYMRNKIAGYTAGTITLDSPLNADYVSGAQVRVLKQYSAVTVNVGITWSAKDWNGTVGGILDFLCSGIITINGTIECHGENGAQSAGTTSGGGFRGGSSDGSGTAEQGEGTAGAQADATTANGNGGGGGSCFGASQGASGGGGGNGAAGGNGQKEGSATFGDGGSAAGAADLTTMVFGGGGGGGANDGTGTAGSGGSGGGIVAMAGVTVTLGASSSINVNGGDGGPGNENFGHGGSGAGGSALIQCQTATLGTNRIVANGGNVTGNAGFGSVGRIHIGYYTSYTGTTTPTIDATQDNNLVTNTTYQMRLSVSSTGSNSEVLAQEFSPQLATWQELGVSWKASTSTATFYQNGLALGTKVGALTAINDNASTFQIAMNKNGAGAAANFYDGLTDEVRVFNVVRTADDFLNGVNTQIPVNTAGMVAYYKLNSDYVDAVAGLNNLTPTNAPVFVSDVPFPSPTTRLDIDQFDAQSGDTYALPTSISESATNRLTFTPQRDPQKSIQFNIAAKGTGNWTVIIHDQYNNLIDSVMVINANLHTGNYEFIFATPWSPLTNFTNEYHAHVISTVADGTVVTDVNNDLETADFVTYFQFLVDSVRHPMARFLNFWVIGNGRYVGQYDATLYNPNYMVLPAGYNVTCFTYYREYLAIGVMFGEAMESANSGRIYFWDGTTPFPNYWIDVPEGGVSALYGTKGRIYTTVGPHALLMIYEGGDEARKLKETPLLEEGGTVEVFPQALTMWNSLIRYGLSGTGTSTAVQKGAYTWGSTNYHYPDILTYDYPASTGNTEGTNLKIGMIMVIDRKLVMSWQDGVGYGVDYVSTTNAPFAVGYIDLLIENLNIANKEKEAIEVDVTLDTLLTGQSISSRYLLENGTTWVSNADDTAVGDTVSRQLISDGRNYTIQVGVDMYATGTTSPVIQAVTLLDNENTEEQRWG